jgi:hypothetical protein
MLTIMNQELKFLKFKLYGIGQELDYLGLIFN